MFELYLLLIILFFTVVEAFTYEISQGIAFNQLQTFRLYTLLNVLVDLRKTFTLLVRSLQCGHLQYAHTKGIDIDAGAVLPFKYFWCHEFGSAYKGLRV
jgi:hypothetical protein